jgi:hypothetical protein
MSTSGGRRNSSANAPFLGKGFANRAEQTRLLRKWNTLHETYKVFVGRDGTREQDLQRTAFGLELLVRRGWGPGSQQYDEAAAHFAQTQKAMKAEQRAAAKAAQKAASAPKTTPKTAPKAKDSSTKASQSPATKAPRELSRTQLIAKWNKQVERYHPGTTEGRTLTSLTTVWKAAAQVELAVRRGERPGSKAYDDAVAHFNAMKAAHDAFAKARKAELAAAARAAANPAPAKRSRSRKS